MSDTPYIPFYTSDFLAGTSGMTASTKGVYITLLCLIYETNGPLTQRFDTLSRRCGCTPASFKKAIAALEDDGKISVTDAGIWSEKCAKHIEFRRERSNSAKAAAKKRWQKTGKKQGAGDASAYSSQCQPEPEPDKSKGTPKGVPKKRGERLPENWALPREWGSWAQGEGWDDASIRREAECFRDYWISQPGQKGVKLDWLATWRNWIRRAKRPQPSLKAINGGRNDRKQFDAAHREFARRIGAGEIDLGPDPSDPFAGR